MSLAVLALVAGLSLAGFTGWLLTRRSGVPREIQPESVQLDTTALRLADNGPTVVHFSAPWCGPCARVRRVVHQVCAELGDVAHVEIDIDADPDTARTFSVLSLPTTLIFDARGQQRYRTSGVPNAADLRSALQPLLT